MKCPNCKSDELRPVLTKQGVEVDYCDSCKGIWLDRGELYHFVKKPKLVFQKLKEALENVTPTKKRSPRTGKPMQEIVYPGGPAFDVCPRSGGLWFDAGELKELLIRERNIRMTYDRKVLKKPPAEKTTDPLKEPAQDRMDGRKGPGLMPLPNLFFRSTISLLGLYAILGAALIAAAEFTALDSGMAVVIGVFIIILQFLIGPFLMDISLRWMYKMDWVKPTELPRHLRQFAYHVCKNNGMKFPRFGIINDGAPQAFTYGHRPNNARIVISRGILELLEPREAEAVVAHELGHAVHWDMFLMTVAQLVPLILYYLYRTLIRVRSSGRDKNAGPRIAIAIGAYILYIITEYLVLWFSRTREYYADRFAGEATGNPSGLAGALVKIAYGLAGQEKKKESQESTSRNSNLEAVGALGIFDGGTARALAISSYSEKAANTGEVDKKNLKGAMRWDLWNPWAKWYELNSTHPLIAHRLLYLSDQAMNTGQEPYVIFDEAQPESYWDEFLVDLSIHLLPLAVVILGLLLSGSVLLKGGNFAESLVLPVILILLGGVLLMRFMFCYMGGFFPNMSVAALLKRVKVSAVRPVPCALKGTIIGRGVPGYIFSEDFVMKDDTGIIFLDYRQPLALWEFLFGLLKAGQYQGREVRVEGWYRRSPVPHIEIMSLKCDGKESKSWVPTLNWLSSILVLGAGIIWALFMIT